MKDIPWEDIFRLSASVAASEFCEWVQFGIDVYIPHRSWFSAACSAATVYRNHFFCLYQQSKSSESKVKCIQASNLCRKVLEAAKLAYANKWKEFIIFQKLGFWDFFLSKLLILFLTKVNLLYLSIQQTRGVVFCIC